MARLQAFKDPSFHSLVATFRSLPAPLIRRIALGLILLLICQQLAVLTWRFLLPEDSRIAGVSVAPAQAKEKPLRRVILPYSAMPPMPMRLRLTTPHYPAIFR